MIPSLLRTLWIRQPIQATRQWPRARVVLLLICFISCGLLIRSHEIEAQAGAFICLYLAVWLSTSFFVDTRAGGVLYRLLSIPVWLFLTVSNYYSALGAVITVGGMLFGLSYLLVREGIAPHLPVPVTVSSATYVALTFSSIVMTSFGDQLVSSWHYWQPPADRKQLRELSLKLMDQRRVRFVLFVCYFLALLVVNFYVLGGTQLFRIERLDTAVIQAFATFVAWDRLATNWVSIVSHK